MQALIQLEVKKFLSRNETYFLLVVTVLLSVLGLYQPFEMHKEVYYHNIMPSAAQMSMIYTGFVGQCCIFYLTPLIASLSHADSYYIEYKNRMLNQNVIRVSIGKYIFAKIVIVSIFAFIFTVLPFVLNQIYCLIAFPAPNIYFEASTSYYDNPLTYAIRAPFFYQIAVNHPLLNNFLHIALLGVYGSLFGILTVGLSLYIKSNRLTVLFMSTAISLFSAFILEGFRLNILNLSFYFYANPLLQDKGMMQFVLVFVGFAVVCFGIIGYFLKFKKDKLL